MDQADTATKPKAYCVCGTLMDLHNEFTDRCPDCTCERPREEAKPARRLL